jgi:hypothetical protein
MWVRGEGYPAAIMIASTAGERYRRLAPPFHRLPKRAKRSEYIPFLLGRSHDGVGGWINEYNSLIAIVNTP